MQNWEVFGVTVSDRGRNWCGNWFFQSLNISNAKTLLSGYFRGSNSWELMNGKRHQDGSTLVGPDSTSATSSGRCLIMRPSNLEKVSSDRQQVAGVLWGHFLRGSRDQRLIYSHPLTWRPTSVGLPSPAPIWTTAKGKHFRLEFRKRDF